MKKYSLLFLVLLVFSCNSEKVRKSDTIPEKRLVPLLAEIHILNGVLNSPAVYNHYSGLDSAAVYDQLFEKYHTTGHTFDLTLDYYASRPDKLEKIYQKVMARLSQMETEAQQEMDRDRAESEESLWNQKTDWDLPVDGAQNKISFDIPLHGPGTYTIQVKLRITPADQSARPRLSAYFWYDDGSRDGRRLYLPTRYYQKGEKVEEYSITRELMDDKFTRLRGSILDYDPKEGNWSMNANVEDIQVTYLPAEAGRDLPR